MLKERHCIFELDDYQSRSTSRNSSRTFIFYNVYQQSPRKNEKKEDVLQFADDTNIIFHSKSDEILLCEIDSVSEKTDSYMRQNVLTLNPDKREVVYFSKVEMVNHKLNNFFIMEFS